MASPSYLAIRMRTLVPMDDWEYGRKFIDCLCQTDARLAPEEMTTFSQAHYRKDKATFSVTEEARTWWARPAVMRGNAEYYYYEEFSCDFVWRRRHKVKSDGYVSYSTVAQTGTRIPGCISFNAQWNTMVPWNTLFLGWAKICRPQVALMHAFIGDEAVNLRNRDYFQSLELRALWDPVLPGIPYAIALETKHLPSEKCVLLRNAGFEVHEFDTFAIVFLMAGPELPDKEKALFTERQKTFESIIGLSAGSKLGRLGR